MNDGYLDGPEKTIVANGGFAEAIWSNGQVENGATILGKVDGNFDNLSDWNFTLISKTEAESFIAANFVPSRDENNVEITLDKILSILN